MHKQWESPNHLKSRQLFRQATSTSILIIVRVTDILEKKGWNNNVNLLLEILSCSQHCLWISVVVNSWFYIGLSPGPSYPLFHYSFVPCVGKMTQGFGEVLWGDLSLISHVYFPELENKWSKVQTLSFIFIFRCWLWILDFLYLLCIQILLSEKVAFSKLIGSDTVQ